MKVKKLIFVDTIFDCDLLDPQSEDVLYIALKPKVYSYLKDRGAAVRDTTSYFTNESHKIVLERSRGQIEWLAEHARFVELNNGVKRAHRDIFIFWTRLSLFYFLWITEIIHNAVEEHKPDTVAAPLSGGRKVSSLSVEPEERYMGRIAGAIAADRGLLFEDISVNLRVSHKTESSLDPVRRIILFLKFFVKHARFQLWQMGLFLKEVRSKRRPVFVTTPHYQMAKLADELRHKIPNRRFYFLDGPALSYVPMPWFIMALPEARFADSIRRQKRLFSDFAGALSSRKDLFAFHGIAFSGLVAHKMQSGISDHITSLLLWSNKLDRFLDLLKPAAFISNGNRSDDIMLAELCLKKNIPTIMIPHGSHSYPKNEYERMEWGEQGKAFLRAPFSILALQSPLAEGYLKAFPSESRVMRTGPLIWGRPVNAARSGILRKEILSGGRYGAKEPKIILHAGTPKSSGNLRLYVYETPDEYIHALRDLAGAVETSSDSVLVVKFRPSAEISVDDLKKLVPFSDKVILSVNESFADILGIADLLVSFSSTTTEEALQNRIPVLLYGGQGRYRHLEAYEIKEGLPVQPSPVYFIDEAASLGYGIRNILELYRNAGKLAHLFDPYIYPEKTRTSLADFFKERDAFRCA